MGLAAQMLAWQDDFCELLAGRGFRVIRFDNRDIGHSTMLDRLGMPSRLDMLSGRRSTAPYLLADMARDTFGLIDQLGIESAHVTGASMGGMIAQTMAILQPQRVRSLVSMMSTTGNRRVGSPSFRAWGLLLSRFPHGRDEYVQRALRTFRVIGSPDHRDEAEIEALAGAMYERSHNPAGIVRQMHAISASGDRTAALEGVRACRPRCCTGRGTRLPGWPPAAPPRRRSPTLASASSRTWATICRGRSGPTSPTRSPPPPSAAGPRFPAPRRTRSESRRPRGGGMRLRGVEPPRSFLHGDLNAARLPVPPQPREQAIYRLAGRATARDVKTNGARRSLESRSPAAIV